ncbi:MAG TPA: hypothetical protein VLI55_13515 [Bryobacteraceae bacterium]|nr:hypothetical protein [Bryobacteraceae bacterium]
MKSDEEYGDYAEPKMYTYFDEVFRRQNLRAWLDWSDEKERFSNEGRLKEFYSWMTPQDEEATVKLPEAKSIRQLSEFLDDSDAMSVFRSPGGTVERALARYEVDHPADWYPKVLAAASAVRSLTPDMLRSLDCPTLDGLQELKAKIEQALKDRDSLLKTV